MTKKLCCLFNSQKDCLVAIKGKVEPSICHICAIFELARVIETLPKELDTLLLKYYKPFDMEGIK